MWISTISAANGLCNMHFRNWPIILSMNYLSIGGVQVKAANLLFKREVTSDDQMQIKVIDFGISCKLEPQ